MKELEALVVSKRLHHNGDPVMAWAISNVVCHFDAKDNIYPRKDDPSKKDRTKKIDPVIALIMAISRMMSAEPVGESFWEKPHAPTPEQVSA
jgi:phage terminase large subunit-like protein